MEDGSETLLGTSVGVEKVERVRDPFAQIKAKSERNKRENPTPFWNEYRAERDRETDLNEAIRAETTSSTQDMPKTEWWLL